MIKLAEDKTTELSDMGLVVMMSAIEHLGQLHGWKGAKVNSLLTTAQTVSMINLENIVTKYSFPYM